VNLEILLLLGTDGRDLFLEVMFSARSVTQRPNNSGYSLYFPSMHNNNCVVIKKPHKRPVSAFIMRPSSGSFYKCKQLKARSCRLQIVLNMPHTYFYFTQIRLDGIVLWIRGKGWEAGWLNSMARCVKLKIKNIKMLKSSLAFFFL
jgi:hypothetical protein